MYVHAHCLQSPLFHWLLPCSALLTNDSDFLVYGIPKIVWVGHAFVDGNTATFQLMDTLAAWRDLNLSAVMRKAKPGGALPPAGVPNLQKQAQVRVGVGEWV